MTKLSFNYPDVNTLRELFKVEIWLFANWNDRKTKNLTTLRP